MCTSSYPDIYYNISHSIKDIIGALDGGSPCRMSIIRNGYVALSNLRKHHVTMSILRKCHVPCRYLFKAPVTCC